MPDQLTEAEYVDAPRPVRRRRRRRTDWRLGGSTVRPWNGMLLAIALVSVGIAVVGAGLLGRVTAPWAPVASTLVLWAGFLVPVVIAFRRSRPVGLLRFRALDVLYAVVLGAALRGVEGGLAGSTAFPTLVTLDGTVPMSWLFTDALPGAIVAPVLEEFFFRAVVLIAVYQLLRRAVGGFAAGFVALLVSTGTFVMLHAIGGALPTANAVAIAAVGAACALLVLLTGRIWAAVMTHIIYNASYLVLLLVGTALS